MGTGPAVLTVLPVKKVNVCSQPAATTMDHKPIVNVPTFVMCNAKANPAVIAATAAALGTPTAAPCVPNTTSPWSPGCATVKVKNENALNDSSKLTCMWGGSISISSAGQTKVTIP